MTRSTQILNIEHFTHSFLVADFFFIVERARRTRAHLVLVSLVFLLLKHAHKAVDELTTF